LEFWQRGGGGIKEPQENFNIFKSIHIDFKERDFFCFTTPKRAKKQDTEDKKERKIREKIKNTVGKSLPEGCMGE